VTSDHSDHSDADPERFSRAAWRERNRETGHARTDSLGQDRGSCRIGAGKDDRKLLPAIAGHEIPRPADASRELLGDSLEALIAGQMTEGVV